MPRSKIILSYFLSGALHASAAGVVLVGGLGSGFVLPTSNIQFGGAGPSLSSVWSPEVTSPFDEGPLVSLSGFEDATATVTVRIVDSTAVDVLRSQPNAEVSIEPPEPIESLDESPASLIDDAARFAAIAPPIRLDEDVEVSAAASVAFRSAKERPVAETTNEPIVAAEPKTDSETTVGGSRTRESSERSSTTSATAPEPVAPSGDDASRRLGTASGTADQAQGSAASLANAASDLPPGAKADQQPSSVAGNQAPKYPEAAYQQGIQGVVQLVVDVSAQGTATRVRLYKTSGHELLDQAALETVQRWRFQPATYQNRPVNARVRVPVRFEITE